MHGINRGASYAQSKAQTCAFASLFQSEFPLHDVGGLRRAYRRPCGFEREQGVQSDVLSMTLTRRLEIHSGSSKGSYSNKSLALTRLPPKAVKQFVMWSSVLSLASSVCFVLSLKGSTLYGLFTGQQGFMLLC